MDKDVLRQQLRKVRDAYAVKTGLDAVKALYQRVFQSHIIDLDQIIAGYYAMPGEIDPWPILAQYLNAQHHCCLPVTCFGTRILQFREFKTSSELAADARGIPSPLTGIEMVPDVILIPIIGFDRKGYRLGQGGGHYDSTLDYLRESYHPKAIGLAYDCQEVDHLPVEIHDQPMDYVITPTRILRFEK